MTRRGARRGFATLLKLTGSLLLAFVLLETGLRLHYRFASGGRLADLERRTRPEPGATTRLGDLLFVSANPRIVYRLRPNLDVIFQNARVKTNSGGWRSPEIELAKPAGTLRILGLGDSVMFGWGVGEGDPYLEILESRLDATTGVDWQAINLAVPGYNLVMEMEVLEQVGLAYDPDLIIYHFVGNDVCLPIFLAARRSVWSASPFLLEYLRMGRIQRELIARTQAVGDSEQIVPQSLTRPRGEPDRPAVPDVRQRLGPQFFAAYCSPETAPPEFKALTGVDRFLEALNELAAFGRSSGVPILFLSNAPLPTFGLGELPRGLDGVQFGPDFGEHIARSSFVNYAESDLAVSPRDPHPSAKGHALIARRLETELEERGILEGLLSESRRP